MVIGHTGDEPDDSRRLAIDLARGERAAFETVYRRLSGWLRAELADRLASSGLDRAGAEELAQAAWAEVWRSVAAGRYDAQRAAVSTYIYAVALNVWRRHARDAARARSRLDRAAEVAATRAADAPNPANDPSDVAGLAETIDLVRRHAFGLADDKGPGAGSEEAHVLRLLAEGLSDRELAQRLGVSPSTAHARKRAALDGLAASLRRAQAKGAERSGASGKQHGMERPS